MLPRLLASCVALAAASVLATVPLACGSSSALPGIGDDGGPGGAGTGDGAACGPIAATCGGNDECCSHLCVGGACVPSITTCGASGAGCAVNTDCCGGSCVNGACAAAQCVTIGQACPASGAAGCCTDTCSNGTCAAIGAGADGGAGAGADGGKGAGCTTSGNTCSANGDCCSGLCSNGRCNIASSYCIQNNDICFRADDCCGGVCTAPNGAAVTATNPGTCSQPVVNGGVNCSGVDGTLCDSSQVGCAAGCCSHLCAPFGPTGVTICQQAQGCHVEGDLCRQDADCCGGESADAGILGAGLVKCTIPAGSTIGVCTTPKASNGGGSTCVPEGDVCHYTKDPSYTCSSSSARADCCGSQTPKFLACKLDKLGVPRCLAYGLNDGGACRQAGDTCATAADCCNGSPCVPDATGQLVCASAACVAAGGACTATADCCAGVTCVIPAGAQGGTCASVPPPPSPPPPPPADGGAPPPPPPPPPADAGLGCASYGQSCASLPCCAGTICSAGVCGLLH